MRMKNHQEAASTRVESARGMMSQPCARNEFEVTKRAFIKRVFGFNANPARTCCIRHPMVNHRVFFMVKLFSSSSGSLMHGCLVEQID